MTAFHINQKAWFVARENYAKHVVEYLDDIKDSFLVRGVPGYATKQEAHERVERFKGDHRGLFIIGPKYGRYHLGGKRSPQRPHKNTQLARFEILDRIAEREGAREGEIESLRGILKDFVLTHGIWSFSNIQKTKDFLHLCRKYNVLIDAELARVVYDF